MMRRTHADFMQSSFGTYRRGWYSGGAMGQARFLTAVHAKVRESVRSGHILDAYQLADDLMAEDLSYAISRAQAVNTVLAAGVVYGASLLLDPQRDSANDKTPSEAECAPRAHAVYLQRIRNAFA